jgi:hypothetical protein
MRLHHLLERESTADVGVDDEEVGHVGGDGVTDWVARSQSGVSHGRELGKVNRRTVVETAGGTKGSILAHVAEQRSNAFRLALPHTTSNKHQSTLNQTLNWKSIDPRRHPCKRGLCRHTHHSRDVQRRKLLPHFLQEILHNSVLVETDDDDLFQVRYLSESRDGMPYHGLPTRVASQRVKVCFFGEDGEDTFPAMGKSGFGAV